MIRSVFFACLLTLVFSSNCFGIDLEAIKMIESGGNPMAFNGKDHGGKGSRGIYQISDPLRRDFNLINGTRYQPNDLFDASINERIAKWAFKTRFPQILKSLKKPVTEKNLVLCFNAGCGRVANPPKSTINYLKKYNQLKKSEAANG